MLGPHMLQLSSNTDLFIKTELNPFNNSRKKRSNHIPVDWLAWPFL
jgi:hypothetical protein